MVDILELLFSDYYDRYNASIVLTVAGLFICFLSVLAQFEKNEFHEHLVILNGFIVGLFLSRGFL